MNLSLPDPQKKHPLWILIATLIILVGYFFAIRGILYNPLRPDELTTLGHIGALEPDGEFFSLPETAASLAELSAQHPPLYFLSLNAWGRILSYDSFVLRLLSVFFGILSVAVVYRLATDIGGRLTAIYTSLLMITSAIFLFYTYDTRQYTMLVFLSALVWLLYQRFSHQKRPLTLLQLGVLTLVSAGAIYTHYAAIFILVPMGLYHLLFVKKNKTWVQTSVAVILGGVMFLPWLPTALSGFNHTTYEIEVGESEYMDNPTLVEQVILFWGNGDERLFFIMAGLAILAVLFNQHGSRYMVFFIIITILTILGMNHYLSFIKWVRYVIVFTIPFCIFMGLGFSLLSRWRLTMILSLLFFIPYINSGTDFRTDNDFYFQVRTQTVQTFVEFQHLLPILKDEGSADDILLPVVKHYGLIRLGKHGKISIQEYYMKDLDMPYSNIYSGHQTRRDFVLDDILSDIKGHPNIWITHSAGNTDEVDIVREAISEHYRLCQEMDYGSASKLYLYVIKGRNDERCNRILG